MKALKIPVITLAALILFSIAVGMWTADACEHWIALLDTAEDNALFGHWHEAEKALGSLRENWASRQTLLHILIPHDELDNAEMLLSQCSLHCERKDIAALRTAMSLLRCQFSVLSETEQFNLKNVL